MGNVAGIIFIAISIMLIIWVFFIREPRKKNDDENLNSNESKNSSPFIDDVSEELPVGYLEGLKGILGPDLDDDNIKLVWDTFIDNPTDPDYYTLIAGRLMAMKNFEKAQKFLARAESVLPPSGDISEKLGDICLKLGDLDKAIEAYNNAIEANPKHTKALVNLATVYISRDESERAKEILLKVLDEEPDNKRARLFYGQSLYELNEYEEAYCQLNKVFKADPQISQTHYFIGMVLMKLGESEVAIKALKKYIELSPNGSYSIDAERALASMSKTENNNEI